MTDPAEQIDRQNREVVEYYQSGALDEGRSRSARQSCARALLILGTGHPATGASLTNLGELLRERGEGRRLIVERNEVGLTSLASFCYLVSL